MADLNLAAGKPSDRPSAGCQWDPADWVPDRLNVGEEEAYSNEAYLSVQYGVPMQRSTPPRSMLIPLSIFINHLIGYSVQDNQTVRVVATCGCNALSCTRSR